MLDRNRTGFAPDMVPEVRAEDVDISTAFILTLVHLPGGEASQPGYAGCAGG